MSLLRIEGLTRRFGGLVAVDNVTLDIPPQRLSAVIGPNGAGKTTLFNMISGFIPPSAGQVHFDGHEITANPPERIARRGLIRTFQLVQLFEGLSVLENVKIGCHLHTRGGLLAALMPLAWARAEEVAVEAEAHRLLEETGLADQAATSAAVLPYGQKRLLEITRALAARPKLLLLDEPAAGLNRQETDALALLLRRIVANGTAILLIEHDMQLVMNVADQVAVLDFGRLIAQGRPEEVRRNPDVIAAYLGSQEAARA
ncbi:ABC transporter ATP-binding protein [Microbacteriaceae bacterium K1510]|nr:ABC transporter ATP-binding protein [Microbacteriaceae bacterium K1510]